MDDEAVLIELASQGNVDAFERLVQQHWPCLIRQMRGLMVDDNEAEDLVQETFIRALNNLHRFRGDSALKTWLHRIALNVVRTHRARDSRRRSSDTTAALADSTVQHGGARDAEATFVRRLAIARAVDALPPMLRRLVILRDVEGLAYHEISAMTGMPAGSVASGVFRARRRLRAALRGYG